MTRNLFRNLWLLVTAILLASTWFMFRNGQEATQQADQAQFTINQLQMERNSQQRLATQLDELDNLTIDERNATRLDILRHLDLEATGYKFKLEQPQADDIGGTSLFIRQFELETLLPYAQALALADKLHNNPKVVIDTYSLIRVTLADPVYGEHVKIQINGSLYGLQKL